MSGYKFRLQKLLDIRINQEEESKRNFKEAQFEKQKVEDTLNGLKVSYEKYSTFNNDESVMERKIKHNYLNAVNYNIVQKTQELKEKEVIVEEKREQLKESQVKRKTVEILKQKQYNEYLKEENLIEQKNNDEFALYGYIRRTSEGR